MSGGGREGESLSLNVGKVDLSLYESIWIICIYGKCFVLSKREWTETMAKCFTSAVTTETICSTSLHRCFECSGILEYNHNPKCSIREFVVRDFHIKISWCSFRLKNSPGRQSKVHHWKRKMSNCSMTGSKFHNAQWIAITKSTYIRWVNYAF